MKKHLTITICCLSALIFTAQTSQAYSTGPPDHVAFFWVWPPPPAIPQFEMNCTECHNSYDLNTGLGDIRIEGHPLEYSMGATYQCTIIVRDALASRWGFEVTAEEGWYPWGPWTAQGSFSILDPTNTQLSDNPQPIRDYVKQTFAGTYVGMIDSAYWIFEWTAPMNLNGAYICFTGNAANNDDTEFGDYIYADSVIVYPDAYPTSADVVLTPAYTPVVIPASGGSFDFNISVEHLGTLVDTFEVWTDITLPNSAIFGPIIGPITLTVPPGWSANRDRTQAVPAGAPAGIYSYNGYVGVYPYTVWDYDFFEFTKLEDSVFVEGDEWSSGWFCAGEPFLDEITTTEEAMPKEFSLSSAFPNPFNPVTTIGFSLPEASEVKLTVYDISGRMVAELAEGWREEGTHEAVFDGTGLSSGVYIYRISAGEFNALHKMVLMK
ncbi:hypothetical protein CEE37_09030 [candidate division LCP-89 bacterium B3_LCP]|uniref:Secretion system C-terminal sorting domain-containing protein n=1 Tax=candidate division LCP-89 bacterium B3_LCP TaxID=2012998 RepID=A0A532V0F6_UNCL8|nr:MAG: hypothetical protein CEE37_09030 [candidate division LCP-89 bacterium B3_LCP]